MRNSSKVFMMIFAVSALVLTGCSDADMAKLDKMASQFETMSTQFESIASNVNTIAEKASAIDTEQITESVESITESAESLADATAETVEAVNDISNDVSEVSDEEVSIEDISEVFSDTPIDILINYPSRNAKIIAEARAKYEEGMAMLQEGYDGLSSVSSEAETIKSGVRMTFDNAEKVLIGANTTAESLEILINDYSEMARDLVTICDTLGIENDNIEQLRKIAYIFEDDVKLQFVNPETIDSLEDAKAELLVALNNPENLDEVNIDSYINDVFKDLKPVADGLNDFNENVSNATKQINQASQVIIKEAKAYGIDDAGLDIIGDILKEYEDADIYLVNINGTKDVNIIFDYAKNQVKINANKYINDFKKQLEKEKE